MFNAIKKIFKKNKENVDIIDEFDSEVFSDLGESNRKLLLQDIIKNREENKLKSLHDDSDSLIVSLSFFVAVLGFFIMSNFFEIPSSLFLGTAVFALYFSVVSLFRTGDFKTICTMITFPLTGFVSFLFIKYSNDINDINNGLSLIALSVSLMIIPFQKRIQRNRSELNKVKDDLLIYREKEIKEQEKEIKNLKEIIGNYKRIENLTNDLDGIEKEIEKLKS